MHPHTGQSHDTEGNLVGDTNVLKYDSKNYSEETKGLQNLLNGAGIKVDVDGYFGEKTKAAVMEFQRQYGLTVDGVVGPNTWAALLPAPVRKPVSTDGAGKSESKESNIFDCDTKILTKDDAEKYLNLWGPFVKEYFSNQIEELPAQIVYKDGDYIYVYALVREHTIIQGIDLGPLPKRTLSNGQVFDPNLYKYELAYTDAPKVYKGTVFISPGEIGRTGNPTGRLNMAGKTHPVSGVKFDTNGFPIFKSEYDMNLDEADYLKSRGTHFDRASKSLYNEIQNSPELARKFTQKEIEIFKEGGVPKKFTWHHNQEPGLMQLVDRTLHEQTGHDGGFSIWGPGNK